MEMPADSSKSFAVCPSGNHEAVCTRVIDLGTQEVHFNGETKCQRKVFLQWEISGASDDDGNPFLVGERYTLSSNEKSNLRKMLESWRGKRFDDSELGEGGFDIKKVIGAPCLVSVIQQESGGKTYANVRNVSPLPKGMQRPKPTTNTAYFSLHEHRYRADVYDSLSDGLKRVIAMSPEWKRMQDPLDEGSSEVEYHEYDADSDIPF